MSKRSLIETITGWNSRWKTGDKTTTLASTASPSLTLIPGDHWGQFEILAKLGQGAFGAVYQARDRLDRNVALKLLDSPEAIREGRILAQLHHPNIVSVYGHEEGLDGAALSMELIQGQSLQTFATERGPLDPAYASLVCLQVCRGLALVHGKGLVHRDIKAGNVMRQGDGRIVLVDFGLGQQIQAAVQGEASGTLPYMAPELFVGAPASVRTDLYAVGVLLYFLVTLKYPLIADSISALREAHEAGRRIPLLDVRPDLPENFIELVERAIHPDPAKRFQSAGAMAIALESVVQGKPIPGRHSRWIWVAVTWAALLAGVGAWYSIWPGSAAPSLQLVRMTGDDSLNTDPALSADGKLLVYLSDQANPGTLDIWVRQVPNGASLQLTHGPFSASALAISPDGHEIAYETDQQGGGIYMIPAFGGQPRLLAPAGLDPRYSPDGQYLAYWMGEPGHPRLPSARVFVMPAHGGTARQLSPQLADARYPVWAPDSQHILLQGSLKADVPPDQDAEWWLVSLDGINAVNTGALKRFLGQGLGVQTYAAYWMGQYLVFSAARGANANLWRARFRASHPESPGPAQRLTFGAAFETGPWVANDGTLAFENHRGLLRIWSFALRSADRGDGERITRTADLDAFPSSSHDGRWLAFTRAPAEKGTRQVWLRNLQHGNETMMTNDPGDKLNPILSRSGDTLAYSILEGPGSSIYLMTCSTHSTRLLCRQCGFANQWLPGGDELLVSVRGRIVRVNTAKGIVSPVLEKEGVLLDEPELSPNQKWIAFSAHAPGRESQVYVAPYAAPGEWLRVGPLSGWSDKPHWSVDGKTLFFYSNSDGHLCIWDRPWDTPHPRTAQPFHHLHNARLNVESISQPIRNFAVTGGRIFLDLAEQSGSIWMAIPERK